MTPRTTALLAALLFLALSWAVMSVCFRAYLILSVLRAKPMSGITFLTGVNSTPSGWRFQSVPGGRPTVTGFFGQSGEPPLSSIS